jgi:phage/plasmid-like protein (TIGR03299 family)
MSHNIFYNELTGRHSFFSVNKIAWHSLGQNVKKYPTSAEAIQHADLGFEVAKTRLTTQGCTSIDVYGNIVNGENIAVPDFYATMRTDTNTVFGVVGKDYEVVQNAEAFNFFDSIVGNSKDIRYETAGALGKGERIFITAKLPDYIRVGNGDDVIEKYLFLTTAHDGSGSITAAFTPIRVVCANTLAAALRNMSNVVRIRHSKNVKQRLLEAHKVMGMSNTLSNEMEGIFNQWSKVRITDRELKKLIRLALAPNKETLQYLQQGQEDKLSTVYKNACESAYIYGVSNDTQQFETTKGTLYGAYNAVTGYFQNVRKYSDDEAKVKSLLLSGTGASRTQTAFNLCQEFAKDGNNILQFN